MKINTTPGETYIVLSTGGCTVTTGAGKQIKKLAAGQDFFTAMTGDSILSDDNASVTVAKGEILSMLNTDGTGAEVQATLRFQPVTSQSALPATGENGVIYLVPNGKTAPNQYTEWVWTGVAYEQLGDASVDLSGYAKLDDGNTFEGPAVFNSSVRFTGPISPISALRVNELSLMSTLYFGDGDCYLHGDGKGYLNSLGVQGLSVMGTLSLGYKSDGFPRNWLNYNGGCMEKLTVMQNLELPNSSKVKLGDTSLIDVWSDGTTEARLNRLTVMDTLELPRGGFLRLGANSRCYIKVDYNEHATGKLTHLSVVGSLCLQATSCMGTLLMGTSEGSIDFSQGNIRAESISVVHALHMAPDAKIAFSGYGVYDLYNDKNDYIGSNANRGEGRLSNLSVMQSLNLDENISFDGAGWNKLASQIAAAAVATVEENDKESFTKLVFPPTGTATEEQDPSWITKKNILMETNGGQLNMTQLTATLAYAAQNRFDIAKRTLWLSTSPGTGDAVQWPANAVFPDDQPQDKIQQLNSNSTYWFDITYVGGQDSILIRKVCSWASTTGESGPTE